MGAVSGRFWGMSGAVAVVLMLGFAYLFWPAPTEDPLPAQMKPTNFPPPAERSIPAMAAALQNPDTQYAVAAATSLGFSTQPVAAARPLVAALQDTRPPVQAAVLTALSMLPDHAKPDPAPVLATVESTPEPEVRAAGLDYLAAKRVYAAGPLMLRYLDDPDVQVRARAYAALQRLSDRDYGFNPAAPEAERKAVVARIRATLHFGPSREVPSP